MECLTRSATKKQYRITWINTDGNRHELWPIYAISEKEAKAEAVDFILQRWGDKYVCLGSVKVRLS